MADATDKMTTAMQLDLLHRFSGSPMAMEPAALETMMARIAAQPSAIWDDLFEPSKRSETFVPPGVGLISIHGPLMHRSLAESDGFLGRIFASRFYSTIWRSIEQALNDDAIERVVLDIDSPGGEVSGLFELVDAIYAARGRKPITALVDEQATSAAYAIASAADRVIIPRSGTAGSIGVLAVHVDESKLNERIGLDFTYITSGARKADGNPDQPLSARARKDLQGEVDRLAELLFETIARNRSLDVSAIRGQEAGVFHGPQAVEAGLADEMRDAGDALRAAASARRHARRAQSWNGLSLNRRHKNNGHVSKTDMPNSTERENHKMSHLAAALSSAIAAKATDDAPRTNLVAQLAESADIGPMTMEAVIAGEIAGPPDAVLSSWAATLGVEASTLVEAASKDRPATQSVPGDEPAGPSASAPASGGDKVIDFDRAKARSQGVSYATEVTELCNIAGQPGMAADFLRAETPVAVVRNKLLEARASEGPGEISSASTDSASDGAGLWSRVLQKNGMLRGDDTGKHA